MGAEKQLVPSLLAACRGQWGVVDDIWKIECKKVRGGLARSPGSENIGLIAWGIAYVARHWRPDLLPGWMTPAGVDAWWNREMEDRSDHGLMLAEEDSRIYCGWHFAPIAVVHAMSSGLLKAMTLAWMRCFISRAALCGVTTKPRRYQPPIHAKLHGEPLFIPQCGARSWSAEDADGKPGRESAHHMGSSAFESIVGAIVFERWHPRGPSHQWELDVMTAIGRPRLFNPEEDIRLVRAMHTPAAILEEDLAWLVKTADWAGTPWPGSLVRFRKGGARIRQGQAVTVSTAPLYTMAIHDDGTIYYIALDSGARQGHNIDREAGGMDFSGGTVTAWAGGKDLPREHLTFHESAWGEVLWIVETNKRGAHIEYFWRSLPSKPTPPSPRPEPPSKPRDDESWLERHKVQVIFGALLLTGVVGALRGCW